MKIELSSGTVYYIDQIGASTYMVLDHTFDVAHFFDTLNEAINFLGAFNE